jgi:hypothetical protein
MHCARFDHFVTASPHRFFHKNKMLSVTKRAFYRTDEVKKVSSKSSDTVDCVTGNVNNWDCIAGVPARHSRAQI